MCSPGNLRKRSTHRSQPGGRKASLAQMKSRALRRVGPEGLQVALQEAVGGIYSLLHLVRIDLACLKSGVKFSC